MKQGIGGKFQYSKANWIQRATFKQKEDTISAKTTADWIVNSNLCIFDYLCSKTVHLTNLNPV